MYGHTTYYYKWPGDNNLGVLMKKVSNKTKTTMKQKPKEVTPHPSKIKQQRNIESILKGAADKRTLLYDDDDDVETP